MRLKDLVIKQVIETTAGLYGLSSEGEVWVYQGHKHGWSKLNMKQMSARELAVKQSKAGKYYEELL